MQNLYTVYELRMNESDTANKKSKEDKQKENEP